MIFREKRILDYSFQHPTTSQIRSSGADGVARYLSRHAGPKRLYLPEARALLAAGLSITVVFEDSATRAHDGYPAGVADAQEAAVQATALGLPHDVPIFYAVDEDTTAAACRAYFTGIASVRHPWPVAAYGDISVVDGLLGMRLARYGWQTSAWSHGAVSKAAHLYQRQSAKHPVAGTDENVVLRSFPTWTLKSPTPPAPPRPPMEVRMLVQFIGHPEVWEVVGSKLLHVTKASWLARGLKRTQVRMLPTTHPLFVLPKEIAA